MKNKIIYVGLVILSILYLLEADFANLSYTNYIAFVIIAITLGSMLLNIYFSLKEKNEEKKNKRIIREAKRAEKENKKA